MGEARLLTPLLIPIFSSFNLAMRMEKEYNTAIRKTLNKTE